RDRDHQAQGGDGFGLVPPAQLLLEAARPLSGAEGVWTDSEIAVHPSGDRRSGAAAGHREADGSDRACAPLHAGRLSGQPAGIPPGGKRRPGDGRSLQAAHKELHYLLELSLSVAEDGRDYGYRETRGASRRSSPSAYHRIAARGMVSRHFVGLASRFLECAMFPLMLSITVYIFLLARL